MKPNRLHLCSWFCLAWNLAWPHQCPAGEAEVAEGYASIVTQAGYPADSMDGVIRAIADQRYPIRKAAIEVLAWRYGQEKPDVVLPILRKMTQDPAASPRATASYWLARFGDPSGVDMLLQDYLKLVPGGADPQRCAEVGKYQVKDALWIGEMLAQIGNPIGLALAAHVARAEEFERLKSSCVRTLGAITHLSNQYPDQARQATAALEELASKNVKSSVLAFILFETERPGFPPEAAARIQDVLEKSGGLPPFVRTPRMRASLLKRGSPAAVPQEGVPSRLALGTRKPRPVRLEPSELEMPISHRESRDFRVTLQGGAVSCAIKEVLTDDPGIEASVREEPDRKGYAIAVTVKETAMQNRTCYVVARLEGCERPFVVLPIKFFRQVTSRPASAPASKPASRPE